MRFFGDNQSSSLPISLLSRSHCYTIFKLLDKIRKIKIFNISPNLINSCFRASKKCKMSDFLANNTVFFDYLRLNINNDDDEILSVSSADDTENPIIISSDDEDEIPSYTPPRPISFSRQYWGFEDSNYETNSEGFDYEPPSWHVPTTFNNVNCENFMFLEDGDEDTTVIQPNNDMCAVYDVNDEDNNVFIGGEDNIAFNDDSDDILMTAGILVNDDGDLSPPLNSDHGKFLMQQMVEFDDVWAVFIDAAKDFFVDSNEKL